MYTVPLYMVLGCSSKPERSVKMYLSPLLSLYILVPSQLYIAMPMMANPNPMTPAAPCCLPPQGLVYCDLAALHSGHPRPWVCATCGLTAPDDAAALLGAQGLPQRLAACRVLEGLPHEDDGSSGCRLVMPLEYSSVELQVSHVVEVGGEWRG